MSEPGGSRTHDLRIEIRMSVARVLLDQDSSLLMLMQHEASGSPGARRPVFTGIIDLSLFRREESVADSRRSPSCNTRSIASVDEGFLGHDSPRPAGAPLRRLLLHLCDGHDDRDDDRSDDHDSVSVQLQIQAISFLARR